MRARLILALLASMAACKSKSEDKASPPTGGAEPPGPGAAGSGSAVAAVGADAGVVALPDPRPIGGGPTPTDREQPKVGAKTEPDRPTSAVGADGFQAQTPRGDATAERRAPVADPSAPPSAGGPAVPTRAAPDDVLATAPVKGDTPTTGAFAITTATALDNSTLTADAVTAKIRATYTPVIRRCAAGKSGSVAIALTVGETGRVAAASASNAFDAGVAACVVEKAKLFMFRVPTSTDSMNPAKARFALTFAFKP